VNDQAQPKVPTGEAPARDAVTGTPTTGHEWDGIEELNTPLPRWWLWIFYATQVWALAYIVLFPAIPLLNDATAGVLGWHSRTAVAEQIGAAEQARAGLYERIRALPVEEIAADEELRRVALRAGQSAFKVNCVQCHGADAAGSAGFANLNDDDWIWGGTLAEIEKTIVHGVRFAADPDTRNSLMPAFGRDDVLKPREIDAVAAYVLSLAGRGPVNAEGEKVFAENCVACHGARGEGNRELGAPRLSDAVWLYSADAAAIRAQIVSPRHGAMPAWGVRLPPATIKELAIYVHSLGGGERMKQASAP
jgi:cytochrome c oxidase cbb3-type subunit 3